MDYTIKLVNNLVKKYKRSTGEKTGENTGETSCEMMSETWIRAKDLDTVTNGRTYRLNFIISCP